jgi:hypothetical protein
VPESHFKLNYRTDYDSMVQIKCSAFNVYPEPKLSLKYDLLNTTFADAHAGVYILYVMLKSCGIFLSTPLQHHMQMTPT